MLLRSQVKSPLILLLILSLISFVCLIAAIALSALWSYIGFMMQTSMFAGCSDYLTLKLQKVNTYIYNIIFIGSCISAAILIAVLVYIVVLIMKYKNGEQDQNKQFPQFTLESFYLLYILYSTAIIGTIPGAGYYLTLIIEKGYNCTSSYILDWFIIGGILVLAFLLLLACWIYLFIFKLKNQEKFQYKNNKIEQKPIVQPQKQPTMKEALQQMLLMQRLRKQQSINEVKEPLLSQVDEQDRAQQQDEKQKIAFVGFDQYKRRQELIKQKEKEQEELIQDFLIRQMFRRAEIDRQKEEEKLKRQQQKQKEKKITYQALSPDDQNFDKIFEESQKSQKNKSHLQVANKPPDQTKDQIFYPANYVPTDEQDQKKYKAYKKKILQQIKPKNLNRHPQNIEGGRSKKKLQAFIRRHKRPQRNELLYKRKLENPGTPMQSSIIRSINDIEQQDDDDYSANFNKTEQIKQQKPLAISIFSPDQNIEDQRHSKEHQETVHQVIQLKQRTKSPMRKRLFEETDKVFNYQSAASILGNLFKGVIKAKKKQQKILRKKELQDDDSKANKKKNERLIDSIRSKYT